MKIYDAMMAAADYIEKHPGLYAFNYGSIPDKADFPCCMLARIGQFLNEGRDIPIGDYRLVAHELGVTEHTFYQRIVALTNAHCATCALYDAKAVPAALRAYAEHCHGIPTAIRAIFDPPLPVFEVAPLQARTTDETRRYREVERQGETYAAI